MLKLLEPRKCGVCDGAGTRVQGILGGLRRGLIAFDFDGTLVNTQRALIEAYKSVGAKWEPHQHWSTFASGLQHKLKGRAYPEMFDAYAHKLPCFDYAAQYSAPVVTSASTATVDFVRTKYPMLSTIHRTDNGATGKAEVLKALSSLLYVDDDVDAADKISRASGVDVVTPGRFLELIRKEER